MKKITSEQFRKMFKVIRSHKMPRMIRTKLYWFLYDILVEDEF